MKSINISQADFIKIINSLYEEINDITRMAACEADPVKETKAEKKIKKLSKVLKLYREFYKELFR